MLERMLRSEELHAQRIVLDVREVTFMDSAGVRVIAAASARARRAERPLILVRAPSHDNRALTGNSNVQQIGDLDLPLGWSPQRIGLRSVARSLMRVGPRQIGDAW
jgi:anti-anti-sigma regulatory factor